MPVLVFDHHCRAGPDADAIVNPNQHGCDFPSSRWPGSGVAFYLMAALSTHLRQAAGMSARVCGPSVADYLDLVALGTVADVVALDGNNRIPGPSGTCSGSGPAAAARHPGAGGCLPPGWSSPVRRRPQDFAWGRTLDAGGPPRRQ